MRYAALVLMAGLAGCSLTGGGIGGECSSDSQCGDDVCARSGECLPQGSVRSVTIRWTLNGETAAASSCASYPQLYLQFDGADYGDTLRFAPVACAQGSFFVDKLPKRYQQVELGTEGAGGRDISSIDSATSQAQLDLLP
jgi:hypothetical protein